MPRAAEIAADATGEVGGGEAAEGGATGAELVDGALAACEPATGSGPAGFAEAAPRGPAAGGGRAGVAVAARGAQGVEAWAAPASGVAGVMERPTGSGAPAGA